MRPQLLLTAMLASLLVCAIAAAALTRAAINFHKPDAGIIRPMSTTGAQALPRE